MCKCEKCAKTKVGDGPWYKFTVNLNDGTWKSAKCDITKDLADGWEYTYIEDRDKTKTKKTARAHHIYDEYIAPSGRNITIFLRKGTKARAIKLIDKYLKSKGSEHQTVANAYEAKRDILKNL